MLRIRERGGQEEGCGRAVESVKGATCGGVLPGPWHLVALDEAVQLIAVHARAVWERRQDVLPTDGPSTYHTRLPTSALHKLSTTALAGPAVQE